MPQAPTQNPYKPIGDLIKPGLDAIIVPLPLTPTIDNLASAVYSYVQAQFYPLPTLQVQIEISSVIYNAINSYRNNLVLSGGAYYNAAQAPFIDMLIGSDMTNNMQPDSFADRVAEIEDNIGISNLLVLEQMPLFLATTVGAKANDYWKTELANPLSAWLRFFSANAGQNYNNTLQWSVGAMNGNLAAYGATLTGLIEPTTAMISTNLISALIGALTITAGKLIFNWTPRIVKSINNTGIQNSGSLTAVLDTAYGWTPPHMAYRTIGQTAGGGVSTPGITNINGMVIKSGHLDIEARTIGQSAGGGVSTPGYAGT